METKSNTKKKSTSTKKKQLKSAYRYSGLALQMVAIVTVFVLAGRWLDSKFSTETAWFTISLSVFSTIAVHVYLIRSVIKSNKQE